MDAAKYIEKVNKICAFFEEKDTFLGLGAYSCNGCPLFKYGCGIFLKEAMIGRKETEKEIVKEMVQIVGNYELPKEGPEEHNPLIITEEKTACPFCKGPNQNAVIVKDEKVGDFFVYCEECMIETVHCYKSGKSAMKAFADGKTRKIE